MALNWGTHLLDIVQWANNTERTGPVEIEGRGEFPKDSLWDVLQQFEVRYRYAGGIEVIYTNAGRPFIRVEGTEVAGLRTPGSSRTASSPPTTNSCDGIRGPTT